jgi:hypothetical protein
MTRPCEYCWQGSGYTYEKDNKPDVPSDYENDTTVCRHCKGTGLCSGGACGCEEELK